MNYKRGMEKLTVIKQGIAALTVPSFCKDYKGVVLQGSTELTRFLGWCLGLGVATFPLHGGAPWLGKQCDDYLFKLNHPSIPIYSNDFQCINHP